MSEVPLYGTSKTVKADRRDNEAIVRYAPEFSGYSSKHQALYLKPSTLNRIAFFRDSGTDPLHQHHNRPEIRFARVFRGVAV